jgi:hypothetical protein
MNRRSFLKRVAATAAVGLVAPAALVEPPLGYKAGLDLGDQLAGASRVVVGGKRYSVSLHMENGQVRGWKWVELKPV